MLLYDFGCGCGQRFEAMVPTSSSPAPGCPACGGPTRRQVSAVGLSGQASVPRGAASAPGSWQGTHRGNSEYIARWQRSLDQRDALEDKYPELKPTRSPVMAHEGPFEGAPLRVDEVNRTGITAGAVAAARAGGHGHPHPPATHQGRAASLPGCAQRARVGVGGFGAPARPPCPGGQ